MNHEALSELGVERRQQILLLAKAEARRRRRRRSMGRCGLMVAALSIVGIVILRSEKQAGPVITDPLPIAVNSPVVSQPKMFVEYVATDPTITDRLSIKPAPPRWTSIGDEELLAELAAAGQPAGIVCMNGKTFLLPR